MKIRAQHADANDRLLGALIEGKNVSLKRGIILKQKWHSEFSLLTVWVALWIVKT